MHTGSLKRQIRYTLRVCQDKKKVLHIASCIGKKKAPVHYTTMPCEPSTAHEAQSQTFTLHAFVPRRTLCSLCFKILKRFCTFLWTLLRFSCAIEELRVNVPVATFFLTEDLRRACQSACWILLAVYIICVHVNCVQSRHGVLHTFFARLKDVSHSSLSCWNLKTITIINPKGTRMGKDGKYWHGLHTTNLKI